MKPQEPTSGTNLLKSERKLEYGLDDTGNKPSLVALHKNHTLVFIEKYLNQTPNTNTIFQ